MRAAFAALAILVVTTSVGSARELRDGANHHLGDDSFVARFGRPPTPADGEGLRMRVHLEYVRDLLARGPATAPELAGRRAELLGYLGDYIARGITPRNTYVPWRNPVFIDEGGNICAVGYLIERSVGRALPERIAAAHRLAYLEDIAAAMPEVAAWVKTSGFSLDELASIQPGYEGPEVQHLAGWQPDELADGKYHHEQDGVSIDGRIERKQMVGAWKRTTSEGKLLGSGTFRRGAGTWKSVRPDGTRLAEGRFVGSRAEGAWRFFHPSGRLAAIGRMRKGKRDGAWTFFHDAPGSPKLSTGRFDGGEAVGEWQHHGANGKLVATATGRAWSPTGLTLSVEPGADGVRHTITQGEPATDHRLDAFFLGKERLYIRDRAEMFDGGGNLLEKIDGAWTARACNWTARRKRRAAAGDVWTLYRMMISERYRLDERDAETECSETAMPIAAARARRLDAMLASRGAIHAPIPAWAFPGAAPGPAEADTSEDGGASEDADAPERGEEADEEVDEEAAQPLAGDNPDDLATYLADHMTWYMEWPHVDETFLAVYRSMPGYTAPAY